VQGRWQITTTGEEGLRFVGIKPENQPNQFIEVRADHTCDVRAYKEFWDARATVVDSPCTWRIRRGGEHEQLDIKAKDASWSFYFDDEGGKLVLWTYTTDPDQWRYYEFAKVRPSAV